MNQKREVMNIEDYREYCLSVKGATECMPFDEHTLVFKVMDKMFTFATLRPKNGRFWADMKCNPDKSEELIEQYEDIFWGPFSDKKHWITVYLEGDVPDKLIKELISHSVEEVLKKLPKTYPALLLLLKVEPDKITIHPKTHTRIKSSYI